MTVDEDALLEEFRGSMPELLQQWEVVEQVNRRFEPYVQFMHDTCAQRPQGVQPLQRGSSHLGKP
jgi:hypothetical protein